MRAPAFRRHVLHPIVRARFCQVSRPARPWRLPPACRMSRRRIVAPREWLSAAGSHEWLSAAGSRCGHRRHRAHAWPFAIRRTLKRCDRPLRVVFWLLVSSRRATRGRCAWIARLTLPERDTQVAVGRRESLLAAGVSFFAFPLAGNADSFEEFMAKKQKKEREEQARKQVHAIPTPYVRDPKSRVHRASCYNLERNMRPVIVHTQAGMRVSTHVACEPAPSRLFSPW